MISPRFVRRASPTSHYTFTTHAVAADFDIVDVQLPRSRNDSRFKGMPTEQSIPNDLLSIEPTTTLQTSLLSFEDFSEKINFLRVAR